MNAVQPTWLDTRSAGVLAHLSVLPGHYGIGNLGPGARQFVDIMATAGLRYWQICPIGPTGFGDSPYQLFSGRAGNPYFIDLGELISAGLLTEADTAALRKLTPAHVDYGELYELFWPVLAPAYDRFVVTGRDEVGSLGSFAAFRQRNADWLEPFTQFMALKVHFGGWPWTHWPESYRDWTPRLASGLPASTRREADRHAFYQYLFFGQWERLRRYAAERGVGIIGDVPIFVALDSADTWQNRSVFQLDHRGQPLVVAGVPPDYFSAKGQLWGNPLYNWEHLSATGYSWWIDRLKAAFALYDIIRLDHFRGFDTYWEIPAGAPDARGGRWRKGPGLPFLQAIKAALPTAKIIAEDLGYIGPDVVALRKAAGLPGMKVLQFAYGHDKHNANLPHFCTPDSVTYTGTHDNCTTRGWLAQLDAVHGELVREYFQLGETPTAWPVIRAALATASRLTVIPLQDLLDLPADATFNRPGTTEGNWQWRCSSDQLEEFKSENLPMFRDWIRLYGRTGTHPVCDYSEPPDE